LRDGTLVERTEFLKQALISISTTLDNFEQPMPDLSEEAMFLQTLWGRSSVASWFLKIEDDQFQAKGVDLSTLSKIKIAINYECFIE